MSSKASVYIPIGTANLYPEEYMVGMSWNGGL